MPADIAIEAAADQDAKTTLALRVSKITREAQDVASFELVDPLGLELPRFAAGAHLDVRINDNIRRQYSLCNDPQERHRYVIAVLNEPAGRGGSRWMHEEIAVDSVLLVSPPRNHFPLGRARGAVPPPAGRRHRRHADAGDDRRARAAGEPLADALLHAQSCANGLPRPAATADRGRQGGAPSRRRRPGPGPRYQADTSGVRGRNARLFLRPAGLHERRQGRRRGLAALQRALRVLHRSGRPRRRCQRPFPDQGQEAAARYSTCRPTVRSSPCCATTASTSRLTARMATAEPASPATWTVSRSTAIRCWMRMNRKRYAMICCARARSSMLVLDL